MTAGPELERYAKQHDTPSEEFSKFGWQDNIEMIYDKDHGTKRPALRFVTASGNRWRFDDGLKSKYTSQLGYKPCWTGFARAMRLWPDTKTLIECNGNASTVAAQYRGIPAFNLEGGEGTKLRPDLIEQIKASFSGKIIVAFDCDATGRRGAISRVREWRAAGFECEAIDLALDKEGGDVADFLMLGKLLSSCKLLEIPPEPPKRKPRASNIVDSEDDLINKAQLALDALNSWRCDDIREWIKIGMAIKEGLGEPGFTMWETWSARSDKFKDGECEKRWRTFKRSDLNINSLFFWADEDSGKTWRSSLKPTKKVRKVAAKVQSNDQPEPAPTTLPDSIRSGLLSYAHASIAPTLDVWYEAIGKGLVKADEQIDVTYLCCLSQVFGRALSEHTARQAMKLGCEHFLKSTAHIIRTKKEDSGLSDNHSGNPILSGTPCSPGRNKKTYTLLPLDQIAHNLAKLAVRPILEKAFPLSEPALAPVCEGFVLALGMEDDEAAKVSVELHRLHGDLIKAQPGYDKAIRRARAEYAALVRGFANTASAPITGSFTNNVSYVGAYARSTLVAMGGDTQMGRGWWAKRLGVKVRTLGAVFKRAGVNVLKEQVVEQPIATVEQLRGVRATYNTELQGFPQALASSGSKPLMPFDVQGPMYRWCAGQIEAGYTVTLRYRQANKQTLVAPVVPVVEPVAVSVPTEVVQLALIPEPSTVWPRWFKQSVEARWMLSWQFEVEPALERVPSNAATYVEKWLSKFICLVGVAEMEIARLPKDVRGEAVQFGFQLLLDPLGTSP